MFEEIVRALAASGPIALVLGLATLLLWKRLNKQQVFYEGDPDDPENKPGKLAQERKVAQDRLAQERKDAQGREDKLRKHYEDKLKTERGENKALYRELNEALQGLVNE